MILGQIWKSRFHVRSKVGREVREKICSLHLQLPLSVGLGHLLSFSHLVLFTFFIQPGRWKEATVKYLVTPKVSQTIDSPSLYFRLDNFAVEAEVGGSFQNPRVHRTPIYGNDMQIFPFFRHHHCPYWQVRTAAKDPLHGSTSKGDSQGEAQSPV